MYKRFVDMLKMILTWCICNYIINNTFNYIKNFEGKGDNTTGKKYLIQQEVDLCNGVLI